MQIVILAAGRGIRISSMTNSRPKTLIEIQGRPILDYILSTLQAINYSEIIIVGGYKIGKLQAFLQTRSYQKIRLIENNDYLKGSVLTILAAKKYIKEEFLLLNADHIIPAALLKKMSQEKSGITIGCDFDRKLGPDDMKVKLDSKKHVSTMDKQLIDYDCGYIGMTYCSFSMKDFYFEALDTILKMNDGEAKNVEFIISTLAKTQSINICDLSNVGWLEIDNNKDLQTARSKINHLPIQ